MHPIPSPKPFFASELGLCGTVPCEFKCGQCLLLEGWGLGEKHACNKPTYPTSMKHRNESRLDASAVVYWIGVALVQLVWVTSSGGISTAQSLSFSRSWEPNDWLCDWLEQISIFCFGPAGWSAENLVPGELSGVFADFRGLVRWGVWEKCRRSVGFWFEIKQWVWS